MRGEVPRKVPASWGDPARRVALRFSRDGPFHAGVVLGSGLARAADGLGGDWVELADIPGLPLPAAPGHPGRVGAVFWGGARVLVFAGRYHAYEGYGPEVLGFQAKAAAASGARVVVFTGAVGSLRTDLPPGQLAIVRDHLDLRGGGYLPGPSFLDLSEAYSPRLRRTLQEAAGALGLEVREVVYAYRRGPEFETYAEVEALRRLGADVVGMSLVPEVVAARAAGLEVAAVVAVTNRAGAGASHEEVLSAGGALAETLQKLLENFFRAVFS